MTPAGSQTIFVREYASRRNEGRQWDADQQHMQLLLYSNSPTRLYSSFFDFTPDFPPAPVDSSPASGTPPSSPSQPNVSPFHKMLSACTGAIVTSFLSTPFDVVKTRMQSSGMPYPPPNATAFLPTTPTNIRACCRDMMFALETRSSFRQFYPAPPQFCAAIPQGSCVSYHSAARAQVARAQAELVSEWNAKRFTGTMDGMIKILRAEGPTGLYRGLSPTLLMQIPSTVVYYVGYEHIRDTIAPHTSLAPMLAGCSARTIAATLISPIELVRTRMQAGVMARSFSGVSQGVSEMVKKGGYQSLWRGLKPTLWRDVPFSGIYWIMYENLKRVMRRAESDTEEFWASFVAGATAGTVAATMTTPFDVAKTIQQVSLVNDAHSTPRPYDARLGPQSSHPPRGPGGKAPGLTDTLRWIVDRDGVKGLFRGLSPRLAKVAPSCAIMISSYELGKRVFVSDT